MTTYARNTSCALTTAPVAHTAGDKDTSEHLTTNGSEWHMDPYHLSPGPKDLLVLEGGEHGLGVSGYDVAETTDESLERVAVVQRLTTAYLRSQLSGSADWQEGTLVGVGFGVHSRS